MSSPDDWIPRCIKLGLIFVLQILTLKTWPHKSVKCSLIVVSELLWSIPEVSRL